ncbi:hypothetical protein [Geothrix oryzisoli]|uniref:hypothetical protein n=1 Tax=Geothrix oryzisoli TaxID=2922721 RepID=UPI001FAD9A69|nr:hypothetical protein [Geothrix oryzisoli]
MKKAIALALVLGAPLAAQSFEVGLFLGQQQYPSPQTNTPLGALRMETDSKTAYAVRFGYSVVDLGPALFQITAGYQPEVKANTKGSLGGSPNVEVGTFKEDHWSAGAMFNFKAVVAVGAGLEFRSEKLSGDFGGTSDSTTYNRVWIRLNAGYAIPSPVVKPFFGLEVAFPLAKRDLETNSSNADFLKALAPKSQIGIYAGIRF